MQYPTSNCTRRLSDRIQVEPRTSPFRRERRRQAIERIGIFLQEPAGDGCSEHGIPRRGCLHPGWDHPVPQAIPQKIRASVAGVLTPPNACLRQVRHDFAAAQSKKGPQVSESLGHPLHRPRRCQRRGPASTRQADEHRFRNVILVMPQPEHAAPGRAHLRMQECEPRLTRLGFRGRLRGTPPATCPKAQTERLGDLPAEFLVAIRSTATEPVIEVKHLQPRAAFRPVSPEKQQQCCRVGTTRMGDNPGPAAGSGFQDFRMQSVLRQERAKSLRRCCPVTTGRLYSFTPSHPGPCPPGPTSCRPAGFHIQANARYSLPKYGTSAAGIRTRPSASRLFSRSAASTRGTARPDPFSVCTSSGRPDCRWRNRI